MTRAWQVDLVNKCVLPVISYHENQERAAEVLGQASCGQKKLTKYSCVLCVQCANPWRKCSVRDLRLGARDPLENQPSSGAKPPNFLWLAPKRRSQKRLDTIKTNIRSVCALRTDQQLYVSERGR